MQRFAILHIRVDLFKDMNGFRYIGCKDAVIYRYVRDGTDFMTLDFFQNEPVAGKDWNRCQTPANDSMPCLMISMRVDSSSGRLTSTKKLAAIMVRQAGNAFFSAGRSWKYVLI
jgi:hypothetical protein